VFGDFTGAISQGRGSNELSVCATSWSISDWFWLCSLDNDCRAIDHHFRRVCLWDFQFASAGYKALLQIRELTTRKFLQAGWPSSVESTTTNLMNVAPNETLQNMHAAIRTCNIEEHNCSNWYFLNASVSQTFCPDDDQKRCNLLAFVSTGSLRSLPVSSYS